MQNKFPLSQAFLRTPFYSFSHFLSIPDDEKELNDFTTRLWENDVFKEAVFIASPELYYEWKKEIEDGKVEISKKETISISILKYYIRSITRSTPFGLFSCYSNIFIGQDNSKQQELSYERYTSLDMHFLYNLTRVLNDNYDIRNVLTYTVNNSFYKVGEDYRYVEVLLKEGKRTHILTSLEYDEVIAFLFKKCEEPLSIETLSQSILDNVEGVNIEEASNYIHSLIDAQILKSNLDIYINDIPPLQQLITFFKNNSSYLSTNTTIQHIFIVLQELEVIIEQQIDSKILGNKIDVYEKIYSLIDTLKIPYQKKYLISSNLQKSTTNISLTEDDLKKINTAIDIVSKFTISKKNKSSICAKNIEKFKERFYKRYEENEVPLLIALDNEIGLGYVNSERESSFSELIDDLNWNQISQTLYDIEYDQKVHSFWSKLFIKSVKESQFEINLENYDLSEFPSKTDELSRSFAVMVEKSATKIILDHVGGSSAVDMISRFSNSDSVFNELVKDIVKHEQMDPNILYTEILHVPDDRQGNVLLRNIDRQYETPFLTQSSSENQIPLQDILVSIKNDKIVLKNKNNNKQIKFYNTTAHNFYFNSLPVYQFICDLQYQDALMGLSLNFGEINKKTFKFLPRITYGSDIVLSPAKWEFTEQDLNDFKTETKFTSSIQKLISFLKFNHLPDYFFLVEGDNQLLINSINPILLKIVLEELQKHKIISLKECLFDFQKDTYCNEIVIPYINTKFESNVAILKNSSQNIKRTFVPGDDWLYYKIFTGVKTADKIIIDGIYVLVQKLKIEKLITSWFFIRYNDPDFHIRVRFKINNQKDNAIEKIIGLFNQSLKFYIDSHMIWKVELATYERELERYEWENISFCEQFFFYDSELLLQLMKLSKDNKQEALLWILSCKCIDQYCDLFQFTLEEKYSLMNNLYNAFQEEFVADKKLKKQIDTKFRLNAYSLQAIIANDVIFNEYIAVINTSIKEMKENLMELHYLEKAKAKKIMISLIHMHINRVSKSNPRAHELILYSFFEKYYRQEIGKKKYVSQIEC